MILADPIKCEDIAYIIGLDGKTPVGYANITEEDSGNEVSFTVAARGPSESYRATRGVDDIMGEISTKVNRGNKPVREEGLDLVGNKSGAQRIDQICSIYDHMVGKWTYVSDWKGLDEFQYSNYTLEKGIDVGSSGKGDCDDFAILLASLIESIGGTPRVIFAYSPDGGHAYAEAYLGKEDDRDVERMLRWLRTAYNVSDLYIHEDPGNGDAWLNMDWWKEPGGAEHPGGPFYKATYQKPMYIRDEDKTSLTPIENLLPAAEFSWTPLEPKVDEVVSFCADQSQDPDGKITNYEWDFGDGGAGKGATKSTYRHIYSESGRYQVVLTVTDSEGDPASKTKEIIISEMPPEAIFTYSPAEPVVGEAIAFDATQSKDKRGRIVDCEWDFDDGYSGKRASIKHQYLDSGSYNVTLTVTNDKGVKKSSSIYVNVSLDVTIYIDKGMALFEQGKYDEAISAYDEAIRLDPKNAVVWSSKGQALAMQGKYDEAISACNEAIRLDPNYAGAWISKGAALTNHGKYDEAFSAYDEAIRLDPKNARAWGSKGIALAKQGKYDEAISAFDESIRLDPKNAVAWGSKGQALGYQGKYDEAISACNEAIRLDPNYAVAWGNKGVSLFEQGKYDEAISAFDESIRLDPNYAKAWRNKGEALGDQGKYDEAISAFDEAIRLDPDDAVAWSNKGLALAGQGKYDEAISACNEAIRLDPNNAGAWSNKGATLGIQGKYDEAISACNEAIRLDPNNAGAWMKKGLALAGQGKYDEAISAFDEAIRLDPNYAKAWRNKGEALGNQGKYDEAISAFDEAIRLDPDDSVAWSNRGITLKHQGKYDESNAASSKAAELDQGYYLPLV